MPTAVHFGAGLIGRGYLGERYHVSGYKVIFVDVVDNLIDDINKTPKYTVTEVAEDGENTIEISNYTAINSKYNEDKAVEEISNADIVTCAVGPNILKFIAPVIAKGLDARKKDYPVAVIACENAIMATDTLKGFILEKMQGQTQESLKPKARFANSAIDRIVPVQKEGSGLNVRIEKFYEWCVESKPFEGMQRPNVDGIHYVEDLSPYIERKLFTVNTGHCVAAYYGLQAGKKYIYECLQDKSVQDKVHGVLNETANLIIKKFGIEEAEQKKYVDTIIKRFSNPALEDEVERVGRDPLRKLSHKDRLISPATQLKERGLPHEHLLNAVEQALRFQNIKDDPTSGQMTEILKSKDAKTATTEITGLSSADPIFGEVEKIIAKVQGS